MIRDILKSKLFVWGAVFVLIYLVIFFGRDLYQRYQIEQELTRLNQEIQELEGNNQEVLDLISYFKTREYRERQARTLLNLQKPGEFAVALPSRDEDFSASADAGSEGGQDSNLRKWWDFFFVNE